MNVLGLPGCPEVILALTAMATKRNIKMFSNARGSYMSVRHRCESSLVGWIPVPL